MRKLLFSAISIVFISSCNNNTVVSSFNKMETVEELNIDSISLKFSKYDNRAVLMSFILSNKSSDTVYFKNTESEVTLSYSRDINNPSNLFIFRVKDEKEIKESFMLPPRILSTDTAFKYEDEMKNFIKTNTNIITRRIYDKLFICLPPNANYNIRKICFLSTFDIHKGFPKRDSGDVFIFQFELLAKNENCCRVKKILCSNFKYE